MNISATANNYDHERNPYYDDAYINHEREMMPENNN